MRGGMGEESWSTTGTTMFFRCRLQSGELWTFSVDRSTLEALSPGHTLNPGLNFAQFRGEIYAAARRRMTIDDPTARQHLSLQEIRDALNAPDSPLHGPTPALPGPLRALSPPESAPTRA